MQQAAHEPHGAPGGAKIDYTIAAEPGAGSIRFDATRSAPTDNDPVVWAAAVFDDANGASVAMGAFPVLWGEADSLAGTTQPFDTTGAATYTAWLTTRPWQLDGHRSVLGGALITGPL